MKELLEKHYKKYRNSIKNKEEINQYIENFDYIINDNTYSKGIIETALKEYNAQNKSFPIKPVELERLLPISKNNNNIRSHSIVYQKYSEILKGQMIDGQMHFYTPKNADDEYYITCYLSDEELSEINRYRIQNNISILKRIARCSDTEYQLCKNQSERFVIESKYRESLKGRDFKNEFDKIMRRNRKSDIIINQVKREFKAGIDAEIYDDVF